MAMRTRARTRATEAPSVPAGLPEQALHICLSLLYPHLLPGSRRTLRLSCKAALHVMDSCVRRLELRQHMLQVIDGGDITPPSDTCGAEGILPPSRPNSQDRLLRTCSIRWPAAEHLALANLDLNAASLTFPPRLKALTMTRTYLRSKGSNVIGPLATLASTLQVLDIDVSDLELRDCPAWHHGLATQLRQLTSLRCLRLTISEQCGDTVPYLDALAALTGLTQLALARSEFCNVGHQLDKAEALCQCLAGLTRLQVLHLSADLDGQGAEALAGALTRLSALRDLSLAGCELVDPSYEDDDEDWPHGDQSPDVPDESEEALQVLRNGSRIAILEQALGSLTNLTRLDLSDNFLDRSVLLLPRTLPHLHTLKLSRKLEYKPYDYFARFSAAPNMTVEAASCSAHVLRRYSNLTHLDVSGCYLGEPDLTPELPALWCNALAALPALRVLRIDECWMDDAEPLCHLAPALRQLTRLEQLDLGGNRVMDRESSELSSFWAALEQLTALTRLDLHKTRLSQSCLSKLTQVLPQLHQLRYLNVSDNGLDSQCAHLLAFCLPQLTSLRELRAGSCGYNFGVEAVLASLQGLTGLEVVEVWSRGRMMFAPVRLEALLPVLRGLSGLVRLHTLLLLPTSITPSDRDWAMQGKRGLTGKILRILPSLQEVWV